METLRNKHWTAESVDDFVYRIASDFIVQIDKKADKDGISHRELAINAGVSDGRLSQVFNNPGNLTLRSTVQYAQAAGMKVALVAYEDGDSENHEGPINAEIFSTCWKAAGSPRNFFDLTGVTLTGARPTQFHCENTSETTSHLTLNIGRLERIAGNFFTGPVH